MVPPELATIRLDLGWHPSEHIGMFASEAYVSNTRELLALEVVPSRAYPSLADFLSHASVLQRRLVLDIFDPDPF
jgi:hypothetical protein